MYQKQGTRHGKKRQCSSDDTSLQNEFQNRNTDAHDSQQCPAVSVVTASSSAHSCHIQSGTALCQIVGKNHSSRDLGESNQSSNTNERPSLSRKDPLSTMSVCESTAQSTVTQALCKGNRSKDNNTSSCHGDDHQQGEIERPDKSLSLTKDQASVNRPPHWGKSAGGHPVNTSTGNAPVTGGGSYQGHTKKGRYDHGNGKHNKQGVNSRYMKFSGTQKLSWLNDTKHSSKQSEINRSSTSTSELGSSSVVQARDTALEIPGFDYDDVKKRSFKILPSHGNVNVVTREGLAKQKAELQHQNDLQSMNSSHLAKSLATFKPGLSSKHCSSVMSLANIFMSSYQKGEYSLSVLERTLTQMNAANLRQVGQTKNFFSEPLELHERREHMLQLESSKDHDNLLCLWLIKDRMTHRLQLMTVKEAPRTQPGHMSVSFDSNTTGLHMSHKITNVCWSNFPQYPGKKYVLFTTMCNTAQRVNLAIIDNMDPDDFDDMDFFNFNLGYRATWTCAWNRQRQQLGVGIEKGCLVIDVNTRYLWQFKTLNSDVIAQVFSQDDGNLMYTGTRRGNILLHDLRSRSTFPQMLMFHKSSISCLQLSPDDAYLYASDFSGKIHKWDMRNRKPVVSYDGLFNQYTKLPFHIDETQSLLYGTGQDCYTKLWCLKTGKLIRTIPPPCPASRENIPVVQYSSQWGCAKGNQGLIMGLNDTFYLYSCGVENSEN